MPGNERTVSVYKNSHKNKKKSTLKRMTLLREKMLDEYIRKLFINSYHEAFVSTLIGKIK